jgi:hypothetical protein
MANRCIRYSPRVHAAAPTAMRAAPARMVVRVCIIKGSVVRG